MSAGTAGPAPPPADTGANAPRAAGTATSLTAHEVWRAARGPALIGITLVLVAVISVVLTRESRAGYLDPDAPGSQGGRALAQILEDRGTTVRVARSAEAARSAAGPDALLLVTRPWNLSSGQVEELAGTPGDRVLVGPTEDILRQLAPGVRQEGSVGVDAREPACELPAAGRAGTADMGGDVYSVTADPDADPALCYAAGGRASLVQITEDGRRITVLGTGDPFTNDGLDERGNAALALNLLESSRTLVWLWPSAPPPASEATRSPWKLVPTGVKLAAAQLGVAVLLVALWRARRLGPVVTEPLPVVVRSAETVEGRGRLYRARRARDSAADALRSAARDRMTRRLGIPVGSDEQEVVAAVAARTTASAAAVRQLLYGASPGDDAVLVRLAGDLDALEKDVLEKEVGRS